MHELSFDYAKVEKTDDTILRIGTDKTDDQKIFEKNKYLQMDELYALLPIEGIPESFPQFKKAPNVYYRQYVPELILCRTREKKKNKCISNRSKLFWGVV